MKKIFYISPHNTHRRHDIFVQSGKQIKGDESLRSLDSHLWNSLPEKIKSAISVYIQRFGLDLNADVNCALSNLVHTGTRTIL